VGRHAEESVIFLIAIKDALDQYFMRHPEGFFGKSHEAVVVDPDNPRLLKRHLLCAAAELYLHEDDPVYDVKSLRPLIEEMVAGGELSPGKRGDIWFSRKRRPQPEVGIRSIGVPCDILNERGEKIGELSGARIFREAHPGAIYLHWGRQYQITKLDLLGRKAFSREVDAGYYTHALSREETEVLREERRKSLAHFQIHWGKLRISHQVTGYDRRGLFDGERISRHGLEMPISLFDTEGLWVPIDEGTKEAIESQGYDLGGTLHAVEHVAIRCIPLFVLGDPGDIGGLSYSSYPAFKRPAIFLYDGYEGGIGFTARAFEVAEDWLAATLHLVGECPCEEGCPSCVQDPQCGSANEPLDKLGAIFLLQQLLGLSSSLNEGDASL
jgi:DEAD/DEAH box helicase domain-containing protein